MFETLVVLGVVSTLIGLGVMVALLSLESLLITGLACVVVGFGLGVPAGVYYHYKLYRYLAAHGGVPTGFFWNPARYHANLPARELRAITPWFAIGALGFLMILFGCAVVMLGVWRT